MDATTPGARVGRVKVLVQRAVAPIKAGLSGYVAEIGASYLMADLGLAYTPRADHAAYLASWLAALKHDPKAIFTAAAQAQAGADWIHEHAGASAVPLPIAA